jgi:hypothetical protein
MSTHRTTTLSHNIHNKKQQVICIAISSSVATAIAAESTDSLLIVAKNQTQPLS